jgi:hypothetical protein
MDKGNTVKFHFTHMIKLDLPEWKKQSWLDEEKKVHMMR